MTHATMLLVGTLAIAAAGAAQAAPPRGDRELGQYLATECVTCHQASGRSDGIPPIIGWPEDIFVEILGEYRTAKRDNSVMRTIAARLSDEDILALAAYFHSLGDGK